MSKKQKKILVLAGAFALAFGIVPNVSAMHIMEGYLPGSFCIAWGVFMRTLSYCRIYVHKKRL